MGEILQRLKHGERILTDHGSHEGRPGRALMVSDQHRHRQDPPRGALLEKRRQRPLDAVADSFVLEKFEQEVAQIAAAVNGGRAKAGALAQSAEGQHLGARQRVQADPIERLGQKLDKLVKPDLERARANLHHELGIR